MRLVALAVALQLAARLSYAAPLYPLRLVWSDEGGAVAALAPAVRAEVDRLLDGADVEARWTVWKGGVREPEEREIHVFVRATPPPALRRDAMGAVRISGGGARIVGVFAAVVAATLHLGLSGEGVLQPSARRDLARALARVIVHELVHEGAPRLHHADHGLMAAHVGRSVLVRPDLALEARWNAALRATAGVGRPEPPATLTTARISEWE